MALNNLLELICHKTKMVTVARNGNGDMSSNLRKSICISQSANTLVKGIRPVILNPAMV